MIYYIGIILILMAFLCGYVYGKRIGNKEGVSQGQLFAPLELRIKGLKKGRCQICGTRTIRKLKSVPHETNRNSC